VAVPCPQSWPVLCFGESRSEEGHVLGNTVYRAVSGSVAELRHLDILANNLANAETGGFKADAVTFREVLDGKKRGTKFVDLPVTSLDLSVGPVKVTDNPMDVALTSTGFLVVQTAGGERLTRGGRLVATEDGTLATAAGLPVMGTSGQPIRLATSGPRASMPIEISELGVVRQGDREVGTLLRKTADPAQMKREGQGTYDVTGGVQALPDDTSAGVRQGSVEGSNVNPVIAMTELVEVQRHFDALQQAMRVYREVDDASNRRLR
jgi:flagellar basal-body rod protein FlgF